MTKYFLEKLKIFDQTAESYAEFIDEKDKNEEAKSRNDPSIGRVTKDSRIEMPNNNNPDSLMQLYPNVNNDKKSELGAVK